MAGVGVQRVRRVQAVQNRPMPRHPALVGVFGLAVFLVYALTTARHYVVNDCLSASLAAWRIATTGTPWFDGFMLDAIPRAPAQELWTGTAANGHVAVFRSPGVIAVGIPGYAVGGRGTSPSDFSLLPGALTAALLAAGAMAVVLVLLLQHLSIRDALTSTLALAFATPMWSVNGNSLWTHCVTVLGLAGMAWAGTKERWWLAGLFGGIALWGRLHTALIVAIFGLGLAVWRRRPSIAVRVGAVSAACMALAAAWSHWMYGTWNPAGPYPTVAAYAHKAASETGGGEWLDQLVNEAGLWISPDRGLLVWTPTLVLLAPAVVRSWRELPDWVRVLGAGGLAYTLVQGLMNGFTGGSSFYGYRLTLECLVCVFPAFALSARRMGRVAQVLLGPLLGLQLTAIFIGAVSEGFFLTPDQAWSDNSFWLALRTVPSLWALVSLMVLVGALAGSAWRQRDWGGSAPRPGEELEQEPGRDGARTRA